MVYYTMDDLGMSMEDIPKLEQLKRKLPTAKVTCFTVPDWEMNGVGLSGNKEFKKWFEKNKDWVEIAIHGLTHHGTEGNLPYEEQCEKLKKALEIMEEFLPAIIGYKPPANDSNPDTIKAVFDSGYDYLMVGSNMHPRGKFKDGAVFTSHIQVPSSFMYWNNDNSEFISKGFYE